MSVVFVFFLACAFSCYKKIFMHKNSEFKKPLNIIFKILSKSWLTIPILLLSHSLHGDCCASPGCSNWYVAASGSVAWHSKWKFSDADSTDDIDFLDNSVGFKTGWGAAASLGYIFWMCNFWDWRWEIEYVYRKNKLKNDTITSDDETITIPLSGYNQDSAIMTNIIMDIPLFCYVWYYVGGGVGASFNKMRVNNLGVHNDTLFAWQFLTGLSFYPSPTVTLSAGYRLFGTNNNDFLEHGIKMRHNPLTHSIDIGVRFRL